LISLPKGNNKLRETAGASSAVIVEKGSVKNSRVCNRIGFFWQGDA